MRILLYNSEYLVTEERGQQIQQALLSKQPPVWVNLNGDMVRATAIQAFKVGGVRAEDAARVEAASSQQIKLKSERLLA